MTKTYKKEPICITFIEKNRTQTKEMGNKPYFYNIDSTRKLYMAKKSTIYILQINYIQFRINLYITYIDSLCMNI